MNSPKAGRVHPLITSDKTMLTVFLLHHLEHFIANDMINRRARLLD